VKEQGKVIRSERYHGALQRSFSLGHDIDEAAATAKLTDGTLELTLPKKATSAVKTLGSTERSAGGRAAGEAARRN